MLGSTENDGLSDQFPLPLITVAPTVYLAPEVNPNPEAVNVEMPDV